jgi:hypothetical protein
VKLRPEDLKSIFNWDSPWAKLYRLNILVGEWNDDAIVGEWNEFVDSVREMKSDFENWKIDGLTYLNFIEKWNKKFGFDVELFVETVRLRFRGYTILDQKMIINDCENYDISCEVKPFVKEMLRQLKNVTEFQYIEGDEDELEGDEY